MFGGATSEAERQRIRNFIINPCFANIKAGKIYLNKKIHSINIVLTLLNYN